MRGVTRQEVGLHGRRPTDSGVAHSGMARRLNLVFSLPVGMQKLRDVISKLCAINQSRQGRPTLWVLLACRQEGMEVVVEESQ